METTTESAVEQAILVAAPIVIVKFVTFVDVVSLCIKFLFEVVTSYSKLDHWLEELID